MKNNNLVFPLGGGVQRLLQQRRCTRRTPAPVLPFCSASTSLLLLLLALVTLSTRVRLSEAGLFDTCICPAGQSLCTLSNLEPASCRSTPLWNAATGTLDANLNLFDDTSETTEWTANLTGLKEVSYQFFRNAATSRLKALHAPDLVTVGTLNNLLTTGPHPMLEEVDLGAWTATLGRAVDVNNWPKLKSLRLGKVAGTTSGTSLRIRNNPELVELDLSAFATMGDNVEIDANAKLSSFQLPKLTQVSSSSVLRIKSNGAMTTVRLNKVTSFGSSASLRVEGNQPALHTVALLALSGENTVPASSYIRIIDTTASSCKLIVPCSVSKQPGRETPRPDPPTPHLSSSSSRRVFFLRFYLPSPPLPSLTAHRGGRRPRAHCRSFVRRVEISKVNQTW